MLILTAYKAALAANPAIAGKIAGGIHIGTVEQGALRPNVLLNLAGSGQGYSHQGPTRLMDAGIVVECRADTAQAAGELSEVVLDFLSGWTGTALGCWVQLTTHENSASKYDAAPRLHICTHEFTSFYRKV